MIEDQTPGPGMASNLDFPKEGRLKPKVKTVSKLSNLEDEVSKLVKPKRMTDGGSGGQPPGIFL